ncbi:hypothetical protein VTI74DRAFT_8418 [Chaetomium olivicolor]
MSHKVADEMAGEITDTPPTRTVIDRVVRHGREYIEFSDGTSQTRKLDRVTGKPLTDWTTVDKPPADINDPESPFPLQATRQLSVVAEHQAEGEPKHWSLFSHIPIHGDSTGPGQVWQVKGDAELMHFEHIASGVDQMRSDSFAWHQVVCTDLSEEQLKRVDEICRGEKPPSAPNRREVKEHCQGWTIRVLRRLVEEGILEAEMVDGLEGRMDHVRNW